MLFTTYFVSYAQNANLSSDFIIQNISNETTHKQTPQGILHDIKTLTPQERYDKLMDSCMQYGVEHEINQNSSFQGWNKVACDFYVNSAIKFQDLPQYQEKLREQILPTTTNNTTNKPVQQISNVQNVTNKTESTNIDNITNSSVLNTASSTNKFLHYENPDYHFEIDYPSYLLKTESNLYPNQAVRFSNPIEYSYQSPDLDINIYVYSGYPTNTTISDLLENYKLVMNESIKKGEIRLISSNITKVSGNDALSHVFYDYQNNKNLKVNEVVIVKNGEEFNIIYTTQPGSFNKFLPDFKKMLDSFKITAFTPDNDTLISESGLSYPSSSTTQSTEPYTPFPNFKLPPLPDYKLPDLPNFNIPGLNIR